MPLILPPALDIPKPAIIRAWGKDDIARAAEARDLFERLGLNIIFVRKKRASILDFSITAMDTATPDQSSYTFSSQSFGAAPGSGETRYIAVAFGGASTANRTISSVTIGGVTATQVVKRDGITTAVGIFIAAVPTGTTGTVEIVFSSTMVGCGILVARIINPANHLGFATASAAHSSGVVNLSLNIPVGGAAMAVTQARNGSTTTWSGLTEQIDSDLASNEFFTAASGGIAGTPSTVTATNADTTPDDLDGVAASWGA
jgi:hypothetical protein